MDSLQRVAIVLTVALAFSPVAQQDTSAAEINVDSLNQIVIDLLHQVEELQQDVQQLRGEVETQGHTRQHVSSQPYQPPYQQPYQQPYQNGDTAMVAPGGSVAPPPNAVAAPPPTNPTLPMTPVLLPTPSTAVTPPVAPPIVAPPVTATAGGGADEQAAYDNACSLLRSGGYDDAIRTFRVFLAKYPRSRFAADSQYWIGDSYYITRRFKEAMPELQRVVDGYPNATRTADALLKLGYIHDEYNQTAEAIKCLEAVIARFPQSTAAQLASKRLAKIRH